MRVVALCLLAACSFEYGYAPNGPPPPEDAKDAAVDAPPVTVDATTDGAPPKQFILAYNINGPAHTGADFPGMWAADPGGICDGQLWDVTFDVTNTSDDPLFQHYQYRLAGGAIACNLGSSLPSGMYEVTLVFGEVWVGPGCSDPMTQRIFDVLIEGTKVADNINTVTVGGCCDPGATTPGTPFKRVYKVSVTDGTVNVVLDAEPTRGTMISAVMLYRL